jgi:hypothetical protein
MSPSEYARIWMQSLQLLRTDNKYARWLSAPSSGRIGLIETWRVLRVYWRNLLGWGSKEVLR